MIIKAKQSTTWISPRKLRQVAHVVRGRDLAQINAILSTLNKKGANILNETIRQAVANAVNNLGIAEDQLTLKSIQVDEGPKFRRFRAGARGMAKPYARRTSHVLVELEAPDAAAPTVADKTATSQDQKESAVTDTETKTTKKKTGQKKVASQAGAKTEKAATKKTAKKSVAKKSTNQKTTTKKKTEEK